MYCMLNPFPDLLFLSILAPTILRIAAGLLFLSLATGHFKQREEIRRSMNFLGALSTPYVFALCAIEALVGLALLVGFYAQIAAMFGVLGIVKALFLRKRFPLIFSLTIPAYLLLGAILLSLILTGAGGFAFDLPL